MGGPCYGTLKFGVPRCYTELAECTGAESQRTLHDVVSTSICTIIDIYVTWTRSECLQ